MKSIYVEASKFKKLKKIGAGMTLIALTNKEAQHIIVPAMRVTFLFFFSQEPD